MVNISLLFSIFWIIISMPVFKPSIEPASYKTVLGFFVVASCVFRSMEHIYDMNRLIKRTIIKSSCLLVTTSHWLDQTLIVQDNFHIQGRCDWRIELFLLISQSFPTEISHGMFDILCIKIQYIPVWLPSCWGITRYHQLLLCLLRLAFYLKWRLHLFL